MNDDGDPNFQAYQFLSPSTASNGSFLLTDDYAANPRFQQLQTELRSLLLVEARSSNPTREHTPEPHTSPPPTQSLGLEERVVLNNKLRIPQNRLAKYLTIWTAECAPWLDMFDQARHFGLKVPVLAQSSTAVLYALLALSARQAERRGTMEESTMDSLSLYSQAISSLSSSLSSRQPDVAVTACILCVLEMMSVSPHNWRRHAEGCATLFQAMQIHGFSGGLLQAIFWCYARMDLVSVIVADGAERTVLPIDKWVALEGPTPLSENSTLQQRLITDAFLEKGQQIPDMHANYAVYLCARTYDLLAQRTRYSELGENNGCTDDAFEYLWLELWDKLQEWFYKRPAALLPIKATGAINQGSGFPRILFAHWAAISSTQLYHVACILMLDIKPFRGHFSGRELSHKPLWHARNVVGISLTNEHKGCLNNAIQPLYVAGRLFTHREEHIVISKLLSRIEARTGWGSRWRIRDLEVAWGYRPGELSKDTSHN